MTITSVGLIAQNTVRPLTNNSGVISTAPFTGGVTISGSTTGVAHGSPYSQVFTGAGGTSPRTMSIVGTLPAGLTATPSGSTMTVSGTPSAAGSFVVRATDSASPAGHADTATITIT